MHSSMIPYRAAYATNISPVGRGNFVEKNTSTVYSWIKECLHGNQQQ